MNERTNHNNASSSSLPHEGMSRWQQLRDFIPVSREKWRQLVLNRRAPQPIRLSMRCTMYSNAEIHRWLADPLGYTVEMGK
jgi:prophage regulatory protein